MNQNEILKSDVIDIIFENKNKLYGAYNLRKYYNLRLLKSMGLMLAIVLALSAFTFLPKKTIEKPIETIAMVMGKSHVNEPKKEVKEIKSEPIKKATQAQQKAQSNPIIVKNTDPVLLIKPMDANLPIGNVNITALSNGSESGEGEYTNGTTNNIKDTVGTNTIQPIVDIYTPMENAEVPPSYPGGWDALKKFLEKNLKNPQDLEPDESIFVKIKFVVGYDGKLKGFETVQDGGTAFNNEVVRVLNKMPNWIAGKSKGKNVSVFFTIPVKFMATE